MSGSRTAIRIRAPSPTPYPSKTNESDTMTPHGGAHSNTSTAGEWWTEEDLKGREAGSSESKTVSAQGMSSILTGPTQPSSAQRAHPAAGSAARPSLSPTATLFQPSRFRTVTNSASTGALSRDDSTSCSTETPAHGGFQYNHETYRTSPSPKSFLYPVSTTAPLGVDNHVAPSLGTTGSVSSVNTESSLLSAEEKAKIVKLTSSSFARTNKAVAIKRPSEAEDSSSSSQTLPRKDISPDKRPAGADASASASGSTAGGGVLDVSAALFDFRPRPSALLSAGSSHRSVTPVFDSNAQLERVSLSPSAHAPLSPTGASNSSSRRSIFSNSLVPYGLSSDEEEEFSAETEASAPSFTTAEAGGGGGSDEEVSTSSTPAEQSMSQDRTSLEEGSSLEGAVREAMRSSDELASTSPKTPPPPSSSENVPTAEAAEETTPSSADRTDLLSVQVGDTPDTSISFVDGEPQVEAASADEGGGKATEVSGAAQSDHGSTGAATVAAMADAAPETSKRPVAERDAKTKQFPWPGPATASTASTSDFETIRSKAVLREEQARSPTTSGSTASEPAWHGMPQLNLDQRARATSFNPFAAPFVPPPAFPAPFAAQPQQQQQQPPPAHIPNGLGIAFGPIGPLALPAAPPFTHADIRYQPMAEMLRQALHENGVLHHKVVKYDQVHKVDHERLYRLTRELEELKQQNTRSRDEPRLDPVQQKQIFDLNQAISRQKVEIARLHHEREAARKAAQQAIDERQAAAKRHEEEVAHENRQWKVALQMREERIDALQAEVRSSEQALAQLKEDHAAAAAASDARLEETKRNEPDALDTARLQLSQAQQELQTVRSHFEDAHADAARTSAELCRSNDRCDELERKLAALEKEREERQTQEADLERLRAEHSDLQRRYDGQKEVLETQSKNLKEAVVQKEALQNKLASSNANVADAKLARDRFASLFRSAHQEKEESERKYRAELDKVQRAMEALEKELQGAVREIIFLEDERDQADLVAADSYEFAYSGMQSLRRLYEEEQRRTAQLETDHATLKTKCTEYINHLKQQLKQRDVEVEQARKEVKNSAQEETARRDLTQMARQRDEAVRKREEVASKYETVAKQLELTRKELEEVRTARVELQAGLKLMSELRDGHRNGEQRAQEDVTRLKDQVTDLERTQPATQQALDEARSARKEAMRLHTDSMAEALKMEEAKMQLEEKMRLLEKKVESLEADLDKAKSTVMIGNRPFVSKTLSRGARSERFQGSGS